MIGVWKLLSGQIVDSAWLGKGHFLIFFQNNDHEDDMVEISNFFNIPFC